jgi:hypothetical protein
MELAFSTPISSAKLKSSVGVLLLRSWSLISLTAVSCMWVLRVEGLRGVERRDSVREREARGGGVRKDFPDQLRSFEALGPRDGHARPWGGG